MVLVVFSLCVRVSSVLVMVLVVFKCMFAGFVGFRDDFGV